jgi:hypothetical protein
MSEPRLTYRIGTRAYLKNGLDGQWSKMSRYNLIEAAVEKLADYEEKETFYDVSMDALKEVMEDRDTYVNQTTAYLGLFDQLRGELLPDLCERSMSAEEIVNEILEKYSPSRKKKWWRRNRK